MEQENQTVKTEFRGRASYAPEDNKLRLYVGRVPHEEFLKLRAAGWVTLNKQREVGGGDFAAVWTPERRDTALEYAGIIEDEDMGSAERAADRAERFAGYREKRSAEAGTRADAYDAGPQVHGFQSQTRAERSAARHDRIADKAGDAWSKAEYWQSRTKGVISHALHVSTPSVRMGRIKELEAAIRKQEKARGEYAERFARWTACAADTDIARQNKFAAILAGWASGDYTHPRTGQKGALYQFVAGYDTERFPDPLTGAELATLWLARHVPLGEEGDWLTHYRLRLAYEEQMLEAQGGRAAHIEMEVGGWIGEHQIRKINKSAVSGRVVSVEVMGVSKGFTKESGYTREERRPAPVLLNLERLTKEVYKAPTPEDVAGMVAIKVEEKAARPEKAPCPLINPTDADAQKLQDLLNKAERSRFAQPSEIMRTTFAQYAGRGVTATICENGTEHRTRYGSNLTRCDVFKVRTIHGENYNARRVVILTDKPQKAIPWEAVAKAKAAQPSPEKMRGRLPELVALIISLGGYRPKTNAEQSLLMDAEYIGWIDTKHSEPQWTEAGDAARNEVATVNT